jgi:hypothetical protein
MTALLTPADLADRLRLTEHQLHELRRKHSWPCVRFSHKAIRFTPEQAEQIVAQHTDTTGPEPVAPVAIEGQTKASMRRRSA